MDKWNFRSGLPMNYQAKSMGADKRIVELLWRNGEVVLQSQTTRKQFPNPVEPSEAPRQDQPSLKDTDPSGTLGNLTDLVQDNETVSWIQYPFEDPFEEEFGSNLFSEFVLSGLIEAEKPIKQNEGKFVKFGAFDSTNVLASSQQQTQVNPAAVRNIPATQMPPPKFQYPNPSCKENNSGMSEKVTNYAQLSVQFGQEGLGSPNVHFGGGRGGVADLEQRNARQCSVMTVGSSHCGGNKVQNDPNRSRLSSSGIGLPVCASMPVKDNGGKMNTLSERKGAETLEATLTSSSGGSGSNSWRASKQSTDVNNHKRKAKDEDSEYQSEAGELESAAGDKQTQKSKSARRSRAAEIHNLSERRRRDRINEKMRALQELIPNCNKTDKASMLDEAIEYLKSLQFQLQVMWIGGGMTPLVFPGLQNYTSRMDIHIHPPHLPLGANPNQAVPCRTPTLHPFNIQNQMQNASFFEQYARYLNFHRMQNASQPFNIFTFGPHALP